METIERLMDQEYPYGGAEYSRLEKKATSISATLSAQLDESGKKLLEELLDIEMQRNVLVQEDAFTIGVCTGVMFMCEVFTNSIPPIQFRIERGQMKIPAASAALITGKHHSNTR